MLLFQKIIIKHKNVYLLNVFEVPYKSFANYVFQLKLFSDCKFFPTLALVVLSAA